VGEAGVESLGRHDRTCLKLRETPRWVVQDIPGGPGRFPVEAIDQHQVAAVAVASRFALADLGRDGRRHQPPIHDIAADGQRRDIRPVLGTQPVASREVNLGMDSPALVDPPPALVAQPVAVSGQPFLDQLPQRRLALGIERLNGHFDARQGAHARRPEGVLAGLGRAECLPAWVVRPIVAAVDVIVDALRAGELCHIRHAGGRPVRAAGQPGQRSRRSPVIGQAQRGIDPGMERRLQAAQPARLCHYFLSPFKPRAAACASRPVL